LSAKTDWKAIFLEVESEPATREPFPLPMCSERTRELGGLCGWCDRRIFRI